MKTSTAIIKPVPDKFVSEERASRILGITVQDLRELQSSGPQYSYYCGAVRYRTPHLFAWAEEQNPRRSDTNGARIEEEPVRPQTEDVVLVASTAESIDREILKLHDLRVSVAKIGLRVGLPAHRISILIAKYRDTAVRAVHDHLASLDPRPAYLPKTERLCASILGSTVHLSAAVRGAVAEVLRDFGYDVLPNSVRSSADTWRLLGTDGTPPTATSSSRLQTSGGTDAVVATLKKDWERHEADGRYRRISELHESGLTYEQIAAEIGASTWLVSQSLRQARRQPDSEAVKAVRQYIARQDPKPLVLPSVVKLVALALLGKPVSISGMLQADVGHLLRELGYEYSGRKWELQVHANADKKVQDYDDGLEDKELTCLELAKMYR